jgi:hypothetical protein
MSLGALAVKVATCSPLITSLPAAQQHAHGGGKRRRQLASLPTTHTHTNTHHADPTAVGPLPPPPPLNAPGMECTHKLRRGRAGVRRQGV